MSYNPVIKSFQMKWRTKKSKAIKPEPYKIFFHYIVLYTMFKRFMNPFYMTFWFITKVRTIGCSWKTNHISFFIICNPSVSGEDCSKLIQYIIYCIAFLDPRPLVALKANIVKAKMKSYWQQLTQNNMYGKFETFFFYANIMNSLE